MWGVPHLLHMCVIFGLLPSVIQSLNTSDKTTSQITSSCLTVCGRKIDTILHPSTTISSERIKLPCG